MLPDYEGNTAVSPYNQEKNSLDISILNGFQWLKLRVRSLLMKEGKDIFLP